MEFSLEDLSQIARDIIQKEQDKKSPDHATLITLSGDLGAGKTTLVQEIAKQLGVEQALQSPTFVIYKVYPLRRPAAERLPLEGGEAPLLPWKTLVHGDMYRLQSPEEMQLLGWEALLADPENIICIEWPEKIEDIIPKWASQITLKHGEGIDKRGIDMA